MYFNWFIGAERHGEDVLTADEAHRMRETQAGRFDQSVTAQRQRAGGRAHRRGAGSGFMLEEHQVVRSGELGNFAPFEEPFCPGGRDIRPLPPG